MPFSRSRAKVITAAICLAVTLGLAALLASFFGSPRLLKKARHDGAPFFVTNPDFVRNDANRPARSSPPPHVWVAADKPEGVRRVVLLGGSIAAGLPMTDYHLGRLIEARWRSRFPGEPIEVINLSVPGADTRAMRGFAREAMALEPDMMVLCAENGGSADSEADLRDIVNRCLASNAKMLFVLPAAGAGDGTDNEKKLRATERKIAGDSGASVAVLDSDYCLRAMDGSAENSGGIFLGGRELSFAGRVATAELVVDGMAALWGSVPRDGSAEDVAAWWRNFPQAESEARRDTLFTGYDEYDMWSLAAKRATDPAERAALQDNARDLRRRAVLGWDTIDIVVAYERAQLQNARDPLTHFTAGRLLGLRGEGVRATEAFERGFALQPYNATALLNYAAMQSGRGDTESARAALDSLEKFDPRAEGLLKMKAAVAAREAELPEAAVLLQKHLALDPDDAEAWFTLSEIQSKLGDFDASDASRKKGEGASRR